MTTQAFERMEYLVNYPAGYEEGKKYPVVLFLHGAGTRGEDIKILTGNPFMKMTQKYEEFSFITVAPHCKSGTWFDYFETLKRFVEFVASAPFTDPERLYLVGSSMGGYGSWQLAMSMPAYFAAVIPICGGGMAWNAGQLIHVPVWAFHGEIDNVVCVDESKRMVAAINKKGGNAKLTLYPDTKHDSWTPTYNNPEVFAWLFAQRKGGGAVNANEYADVKKFG